MAQLPKNLLRNYFSGLTEQAFMEALGIGDPPLIDYLSDLLVRFLHMDELHRLAQLPGKRFEEVAEMILVAQGMPEGGLTRREVYRHIGDFTLFWTGVYPEALKRLRSWESKDCFIDYTNQGKRSYLIASSFEEDEYREECVVLRRLSDSFELCAYGLNQVRKEWQHARPGRGEVPVIWQ
jgi:hypothetical protein